MGEIIKEVETVDVTYEVQVPRVVPVPFPEERVEYKEVIVPHIRRIEEVVQVPKEEVISRNVPVEQVNTTRTVRHVPKFVSCYGGNASEAVRNKSMEDQQEDELRALTFYMAELEKQRNDLRLQCELRAQQVIATQSAIDEELRIRVQLEARHQSCQCKTVREFKSDCSPYISTGIYLPGSTTTPISPYSVKEKVVVKEEVDVKEKIVVGNHTIIVEEEIDINYEICVVTGRRQPYRPGPGNSCEWMYGDAASGMLGFQALAGLNPLRWSGETTFNRAITQLRKVQNRPIILKVPANTLGQELYFNTKDAAIGHLMNLHRGLIGLATNNDPRLKGKRPTDAALWVAEGAETIRV